MENTDHKF